MTSPHYLDLQLFKPGTDEFDYHGETYYFLTDQQPYADGALFHMGYANPIAISDVDDATQDVFADVRAMDRIVNNELPRKFQEDVPDPNPPNWLESLSDRQRTLLAISVLVMSAGLLLFFAL